MKRFVSTFSSMFVLLALAACGGAPNAPAATSTPPTANAPTVTATSGALPTVNATSVPVATATTSVAIAPTSAATRAATAVAANTSAPAGTPDNSVPTLAPNAPNTSFQTARVLDKAIRVSVKDSTFYFKIDVPRGGVISSTLALDAFSPTPAKLALFDEFQNYLKEVSVPPGRSAPLRFIFGNKAGGTTYLVLSGNSSVTLAASARAQNDGGSKGDAGDDLDTATNAQPGTLTGLIGDADSDDVFVFDLPKSGGVLSTTVKTSDGNVKLTVYDEGKNYVGETTAEQNKPTAGTFQHVLAATQGGRWFVQLRGEGTYTISVAFTAQNDAGSGKDAGADFDTALAVKPGSYTGLLGDSDSDDVYSLDLPKTGSMVTITLRTTNGNLKATLFDESQNFVNEIASDKTKTSASMLTTMLAFNQGGKWYVHLRGDGTYSVGVAYTPQNDAGSGKDAGDSKETALTVSSATFTGAIGYADARDYFKIRAAQGRKINVKYSGNQDELKITLFDLNENFIKDASVKSGAAVDLVEDSGATDDYFLDVTGGTGSYTITLAK